MILLLVHAGATLCLVGLIWTIQLVHYPLMSDIGGESFTRYQERHMRSISYLVGPLMAVEGITSVALVVVDPSGLAAAGLVLLIAIWLSTALLQVPCHKRLTEGFDPGTHARLVLSNWIRTLLWTCRGALALTLLV